MRTRIKLTVSNSLVSNERIGVSPRISTGIKLANRCIKLTVLCADIFTEGFANLNTVHPGTGNAQNQGIYALNCFEEMPKHIKELQHKFKDVAIHALYKLRNTAPQIKEHCTFWATPILTSLISLIGVSSWSPVILVMAARRKGQRHPASCLRACDLMRDHSHPANRRTNAIFGGVVRISPTYLRNRAHIFKESVCDALLGRI